MHLSLDLGYLTKIMMSVSVIGSFMNRSIGTLEVFGGLIVLLVLN